jgi:hypothetical protein
LHGAFDTVSCLAAQSAQFLSRRGLLTRQRRQCLYGGCALGASTAPFAITELRSEEDGTTQSIGDLCDCVGSDRLLLPPATGPNDGGLPGSGAGLRSLRPWGGDLWIWFVQLRHAHNQLYDSDAVVPAY